MHYPHTIARESANDSLEEYFESIGGRPSKGDKKRKQKADDESTPKSRGRKKRKTDGAEEEEQEAAPKQKKSKMNWEPPKGSWESDIMSLDSIEELVDPKTGGLKRYGYIQWSNSRRSKHDIDTLRIKAPQKVRVPNLQPLVLRRVTDFT